VGGIKGSGVIGDPLRSAFIGKRMSQNASSAFDHALGTLGSCRRSPPACVTRSP
jgi:hypothetical protein